MARMFERHGDEAGDQRGADRRRRQRPCQRKAEEEDQRDLHRPDMAEVLRSPFADARQVLHAHQPERKDQRLDAIRVDERGADRREAEQRPGSQDRNPRPSRGRGDGLECERPDQREAENEAAVHVRPQGHQRREQERRRGVPVARFHEPDGPCRDDGQRQHMRAREQIGQPKRDAERDRDPERRAGQVARDPEPHDQRRARRGGGGQKGDAAPSAGAEGGGQEDLGQPLVRRPRRARHRMAEWIGVRDGAVRENPIAGRQMRPGVPVAEHPQGEGRLREQPDRDQRENEARHARGGGCRAGGRGGERQGERHVSNRAAAEIRAS